MPAILNEPVVRSLVSVVCVELPKTKESPEIGGLLTPVQLAAFHSALAGVVLQVSMAARADGRAARVAATAMHAKRFLLAEAWMNEGLLFIVGMKEWLFYWAWGRTWGSEYKKYQSDSAARKRNFMYLLCKFVSPERGVKGPRMGNDFRRKRWSTFFWISLEKLLPLRKNFTSTATSRSLCSRTKSTSRTPSRQSSMHSCDSSAGGPKSRLGLRGSPDVFLHVKRNAFPLISRVLFCYCLYISLE